MVAIGGDGLKPARLRLSPTPDAAYGRSYRVTVYKADKTVKAMVANSGWEQSSVKDRRIYEGSDEFFNYCINEHKPLRSSHLRLYCVLEGGTSTWRAVFVAHVPPGSEAMTEPGPRRRPGSLAAEREQGLAVRARIPHQPKQPAPAGERA
jgi:hypothetical protein